MVFGSNNFLPFADIHGNLHYKVIPGATGFVYKNQLEEWAKDFGAKEVHFATPIAAFWMQ